jgi:hypothetical protein
MNIIRVFLDADAGDDEKDGTSDELSVRTGTRAKEIATARALISPGSNIEIIVIGDLPESDAKCLLGNAEIFDPLAIFVSRVLH